MGMIIKNKTPYSSSSIIVELTQAEYDALSTQEKNSNVFYCITDVNGDEQSFQPIIYSTEEREIGVWIDGKPLYQKSINVTSITSASFTVPFNVSNMDKLVDLKGMIYMTGGTGFEPFNDPATGIVAWMTRISDFTTGADVTIGSNRYNQGIDSIIITIQYTKTTDTPGSGIWTPSGVPAVHYSTDEQIVGTWIDGKTVYEKTLYYSSISASTNDWTQLIQFDEADMLLSYNTRATWNNRQIDNAYLRISLYNGYLYHYEGELANGSTLSNYCATIRYTKSTSSS